LIMTVTQGGGNPRACYEPTMSRRSSLDRGGPRTKPRSCGIQPAYESLPTVVLVPSPTLRIYISLHPAAPEEIAMKQGVDCDHESRLLKNSDSTI
jgi:hypothetical protein